jgi:MoxR-like ATPase
MLENRVLPLQAAIERVMVGQKHVIRRIVMALFSVGQRDFFPDGSRFLGTGHVLCEGPTGSGKTVVCKSLSILLGGNNRRVSGMPDALASDITGCEIILLTGDTKTVKGPMFANVVLIDEVNRFPPKAQNAFIEALAEGAVTIGNETFRLQQPFFCLATQNPTEQRGTSKIQEALADRFMFKLVMQETSLEEKVEIAKLTHQFDSEDLKQVITTEQVCEAREFFFDNTYVSDDIRVYAATILHMVNHPDEYGVFKKELEVLNGNALFKQRPAVNDRAMIFLEGASMMEAVMAGRDYVLPADVRAVAPDVLRSRLLLSEYAFHTLSDLYPGLSESDLVEKLLMELMQSLAPC